jgi:hypothetical protein
MYWAKTVDIVYSDGYSKVFTYLMCDSFEEFAKKYFTRTVKVMVSRVK